MEWWPKVMWTLFSGPAVCDEGDEVVHHPYSHRKEDEEGNGRW